MAPTCPATSRGAVWALFIGGYLTVADRLPAMVSRPLAGIGTISYSIYLLHFLVIEQLVGHRWGWRPATAMSMRS